MLRFVPLALLLLGAAGCDRKVAGGSTDGEQIFSQACASCHGPAGVPPEAMSARLGVKDLTDPALHQRLSDADLRHQIIHGSGDGKMPAFGDVLTEAQLAALVDHVRSLKQ